MVSFAGRLKQLRHGKKLTVHQVAKKLRVDPSTISRWENGLTLPSWKQMSRLCKVFKVELSELV